MRFVNFTVVVTGGTKGIGLDIVKRFRTEGANVVFSGRDRVAGHAVEQGTGAIFYPADVRNEEDAGRTIFKATELFGRVDILVNNAGRASPYNGMQHTQADEFTEPFQLHVVAAVNHIRYALPIMRAQRSGSIINIASIAGHRGHGDGRVPYAVSKAALIALSHSLAPELNKYGICINSLSPGHLDKGVGVVTDAVMFLASSQSEFITGTDITVDGGLTCGSTYV